MNSTCKLIFAICTIWVFLTNCKKKGEEDLCNTTDLKVEITVSNDKSTLTAIVSGGLPPYHYSWTNSNIDNAVYQGTNLSGTYQVVVTDDINCTAFSSVTVNPNSSGCGGSSVVYSDDHQVIYNVIPIGTQCWTRQDINDETTFPKVEDASTWENLTTPAWCYARNNKNEIITRLYNGYAVASGKLCPKGWHIPTKGDWETLIYNLGGESLAGAKLKTYENYWEKPVDIEPTANSYFEAIPGGRRQTDGSYLYQSTIAHYWSQTLVSDLSHYGSVLIPGSGTNVFNGLYWSFNSGLSCRCVKD